MALNRLVLSVSRRTDIPAFHLDWFVSGLEKGTFIVKNPVNGKPGLVPATRDKVAGFVFWSKDYASFLRQNIGEKILHMGMGVYFQFTINSPSILERNVPALSARFTQLEELASRFGTKNISWRFDPICHWKDSKGVNHHNMDSFLSIAEHAAGLGISHCITSFLDLYPKVRRRAEKEGIFFYDPGLDRKREILSRMAKRLSRLGMELRLCCEDDLLPVEGFLNVHAASCIPGTFLEESFGALSKRKDPGQRKGCHCTLSRDIGSYAEQACLHHCLYCYAN